MDNTTAVKIISCLLFLSFWAQVYAQNPVQVQSHQEGNIIEVHDANTFVNAIGPDRTIVIKGPVILPDVDWKGGEYYSFQEAYDGDELVINNVSNLKIVGGGTTPAKIVTRPSYGEVIIFDNCTNITIDNVEAGHGPKKGYCTGGVFSIRNSRNFTITNSILYGSGTMGIMAEGVTGLSCDNITIYGCTYHVMWLRNTRQARFTNSVFRDNERFGLINIKGNSEVTFDQCTFTGNRTGTQKYSDYALFSVDMGTTTLNDCTIQNNEACYFSTIANAVNTNNVTRSNNRFVKGEAKR